MKNSSRLLMHCLTYDYHTLIQIQSNMFFLFFHSSTTKSTYLCPLLQTPQRGGGGISSGSRIVRGWPINIIFKTCFNRHGGHVSRLLDPPPPGSAPVGQGGRGVLVQENTPPLPPPLHSTPLPPKTLSVLPKI